MPARGSIHCFNPHTRVGHNGLGGHDHARVIDISIHAPAWGTTSSAAAAGPIRSCFNPRAHVGRDTFTLFRINEIMSVSIHAPAWGATLWAKQMALFNFWFQSTRPRGARRADDDPGARHAVCFNPRARVGRDVVLVVLPAQAGVFQSTRPRGARPRSGQFVVVASHVSIHAPAWGATRLWILALC